MNEYRVGHCKRCDFEMVIWAKEGEEDKDVTDACCCDIFGPRPWRYR